MSSKLTRRTAIAALATTPATAASAESLSNRLMHVEHISDKAELRALGYQAADAIRRSNPEPAGTDPIFAAITAHKAAIAEIDLLNEAEDVPEEVMSEACDVEIEARRDLLLVEPKSVESIAMLLEYLGEPDTDEPGKTLLTGASDFIRLAEDAYYFLPRLAATLRTLVVS